MFIIHKTARGFKIKYGYVRVSTVTQNIERQLEEIHKFGINDNNICIVYQRGKDFERKNYKKLKK